MTVNSTANRISYTGNGATTAFAFPYYFQMAADLVVLETVIATGVQTTKALTTDYTISGTTDANGYYPNGGTVNAVTAPASTVTWTIYRDPARTQLTQHVDGDSMPAASIDGPLDKLTMIVQRHDDLLARSLRQPDGDTANIPALPSSVSRANGGLGSYAGWDASGNPTTYVPAGGQAAVSVAMSPVVTAVSLSAARTAMGVAIGTDVQAHGANLDTLSALSTAAGNFGQTNVVGQAGGWVLATLVDDANLIVNPAMEIDQANEGASVSVATGSSKFIADQWQVSFTGAATGLTAQRVADAPSGLLNSLKVTIGTGSATVNAGDSLTVFQNIEGLDCIDLAFGGASAKAVSVGFWVKASITGTFGYALRNSAQNRSYMGTFTIAQAATWQFVPVANIPGDTAGTWLTTNGVGLSLTVTLMAGSTFQGTAGAWTASNLLTTSAQTNLAATTGATFQVTGVKLQQGPNLTPLVRRKQSAELMRCQRYYEKSYDIGTALGTVTTAGEQLSWVNFTVSATYGGAIFDRFKTTKRATPTITTYSPATGTSGKVRDLLNSSDITPTISDQGMCGFTWVATMGVAQAGWKFSAQWTADARL